MTYQELDLTDDLSYTVPTKINSNFRLRSSLNVVAKSANFTIWTDDAAGSPKDVYLVTTAAATITVTLPTAVSGDAAAGRTVTIMKADAGGGSITIDADGSEVINGATTKSVATQFHYVTLVSDGTAWFIIANN